MLYGDGWGRLMHDGLQFQIIFHILFAVEGFSAWKGKSLLHSSVAALDEGPEFDQKKYEDIAISSRSRDDMVASSVS